jgi:hypothetical protein
LDSYGDEAHRLGSRLSENYEEEMSKLRGESGPAIKVPCCKIPGLFFREQWFFFFLHGRLCEENDLQYNGRFAVMVRSASSSGNALFVDTAQVQSEFEDLRYMFDSEANDYFGKEGRQPDFNRRQPEGLEPIFATTFGTSKATELGFAPIFLSGGATCAIPRRKRPQKVSHSVYPPAHSNMRAYLSLRLGHVRVHLQMHRRANRVYLVDQRLARQK